MAQAVSCKNYKVDWPQGINELTQLSSLPATAPCIWRLADNTFAVCGNTRGQMFCLSRGVSPEIMLGVIHTFGELISIRHAAQATAGRIVRACWFYGIVPDFSLLAAWAGGCWTMFVMHWEAEAGIPLYQP